MTSVAPDAALLLHQWTGAYITNMQYSASLTVQQSIQTGAKGFADGADKITPLNDKVVAEELKKRLKK